MSPNFSCQVQLGPLVMSGITSDLEQKRVRFFFWSSPTADKVPARRPFGHGFGDSGFRV